jgi:hypothetical protein
MSETKNEWHRCARHHYRSPEGIAIKYVENIGQYSSLCSAKRIVVSAISHG